MSMPPGRCQADAPGVNPPPVGSRIRLACVGANGAVSARSNDVEIREYPAGHMTAEDPAVRRQVADLKDQHIPYAETYKWILYRGGVPAWETRQKRMAAAAWGAARLRAVSESG